MTPDYPLWLDVSGRRVVVVGGGQVALRRIPGLLDAGAVVTVVASAVLDEIRDLDVDLAHQTYDASLISDAWLVIACTDDTAVNARVAADSEARRIWCVRSDEATRSAAWVPSVARVDDIGIAVVGGGDPLRAVALRNALTALLMSGDLPARRQRRGGGRVVLVGGGPGAMDLLTLQGFRALLDADVVVHDRLSPGEVLEFLPPEVDIVDVGKAPGSHVAKQDEINQLIVKRALAGDVVVRLKGGDPFIFGRGSEEVAACNDAGVPVEVIPGLSSATAAPTLSGIPITQRGTAQLFTVVSGHVPPGDPRSEVDWASLARSGGTLVLLMAVANLPAIATALMSGGMDSSTPVAVIESASLPEQRVIRLGLATLIDEPVNNPAVVVVGEVAG